MVDLREGITCQQVIAGVVVRYHSLYAGIANVLQLLVIRTVRISFPGVKSRCTPANIQYLLYFNVIGVKYRCPFKRITRESAIKIIDNQRLIFGLYNQPDVTISAKV